MFIGDIDIDCRTLVEKLETLDFYRGTERRTGQFLGSICKKGGGSMLYGTTWKGFLKYNSEGEKVYRTKADKPGRYKTKCMDSYPELEDIFKRFTQLYIPDFYYTQIQLNKDFTSPPHYDSRNIAESIIIGLGDYKGGELNIEKENGEIDTVDIKNTFYRFDGANNKHWTSTYEGKRYSIVFFNNVKA